MTNLRIGLLLLIAPFLGVSTIFAQIKGLFEKEPPVFTATVVPTAEPGSVLLIFYYTHSKATSIESSVWLRDEGTSMGNNGTSTLVRDLRETGNRQQDTLVIKGLESQHFYTFGLDYRSVGFMTSKFNSTVLKSGFRYEAPFEKEVLVKQDAPSQPESDRCNNPDIFVQVASNGFCGSEDRPAVQLQCLNCQGKAWDFNVQLRTENGSWESLRADGLSQSANGNGVRVEPLCTVQPGVYYVRVLARGENCPNSVVHNVGVPIAIVNNISEQPRNNTSLTMKGANMTLPDTCVIRTIAYKEGNSIKGTIELNAGSPCGNYHPYAKVQYVHPGYRDMTTKPIMLSAGVKSPFEILLDSRDLTRRIQTMQVVTYISPALNSEGIPMSASWIKVSDAKPIEPEVLIANDPTTESTPTKTIENTPVKEFEQSSSLITDANVLGNEIDEITVRASDPNCNQIQELRMVYFTNQSDRPLYISWMNPRCCQEDGCKYTVWAGADPDHLRILVEGSKRGTFIKELVQDLTTQDTYVEIAVKTSNGMRKAAYVIGEGAKYGIEEILNYRDRLKPQKADPIKIETEAPTTSPQTVTTNPASVKQEPQIVKPTTETGKVGGALAARGANTPTIMYQKPQMPIVEFKPCKYARETLVVGNRPAKEGELVKIQYDFSDKDYRYTLYLQPENSTEWFVAPGTKELQESPVFDLKVTQFYTGKYVILVKKAESTWGCLAQPIEQPIELQVVKK